MNYKHQKFSNINIQLHDIYTKCTFDSCEFEINGWPFGLHNCHFEKCTFVIRGMVHERLSGLTDKANSGRESDKAYVLKMMETFKKEPSKDYAWVSESCVMTLQHMRQCRAFTAVIDAILDSVQNGTYATGLTFDIAKTN